jgi:hypothetical protein
MDMTAHFLSRLQFAFTVSFHIIFPSFTIGLAAWLTVLEAWYLASGRSAYRLVFEFWLKLFRHGIRARCGLGDCPGVRAWHELEPTLPLLIAWVGSYLSVKGCIA